MKAPTCVGCAKPILELIGQFEKLDSYFLEDGGPPRESAGYWHTLCLIESPYGSAWCAARLRNFVEVRRFERLAEVDSWTVIRDRRTRQPLAFSLTGEFLHIEGARGKPRNVDGGSVYRISSEYNLELDDGDLISAIQEALVSNGTYSIPKMMEALDIGNRINHPAALEKAVFRFDRGLRRHWQSRFVSAQAEYGRFVPKALEEFFSRGAA